MWSSFLILAVFSHLLVVSCIPTVSSSSPEKGHYCHYALQYGYKGPVRKVRAVPFNILNVGSSRGVVEVDDEENEEEDEAETTAYGPSNLFPVSTPRESQVIVLEDSLGRLMTRCRPREACFSSWTAKHDPKTNGTKDTLLISGCWGEEMLRDPFHKCQKDACINVDSPKLNGTRFCCCFGDMCNANFSDAYVGPPLPVGPLLADSESSTQKYVWIRIGAGIAIGMVIISGLFGFLYRVHRKRKDLKRQQDEELKTMEAGKSVKAMLAASNEGFDCKVVQFGECLAHGRYGAVYLASAFGKTFAVKLFALDNRAYFMHEWQAYNQPLMQSHDALLKYFAADESVVHMDGAEYHYWLVVEFHPNQALIEYLKKKTIDAATLARMSLSLASGLAFLHSEINQDGKTKPPMVHRDFNSRNILVRNDLSVCICDMGFALALKIPDSSIPTRPEDTPILNDVGTIRYMAPEVLEGSLNLRDSGTALRQVDMYAFGLVLWEIASRCADLYQGLPVPDYQLPYQKEAGMHPTFAQMQNLVARKKARPLFPEVWKDANAGIKFLKETMDECWDADAEARLTANCVKERLTELPTMWDKCPTPNNIPEVHRVSETLSNSEETVVPDEPSESNGLLSDFNRDLNVIFVPPTKNVNEMRELYGTSLPMVPSLPSRVQPHQGRNPCQERNIKPESSDELTSSGNNLVGKKGGNKNGYNTESASRPPAFELSVNTANRVLENIENWVGNRNSGGVEIPPNVDGRTALKKKVPNTIAAQQNRENGNFWFNMFRKKPTLNSLMSYRAVVPPASSCQSAGTNQTDESKCNIRAAAGILPQMLRRDVPDSSNTTQVTCLSPSPSTSGASPPRMMGHSRVPRFSLIRDGVENSRTTDDEEASAGQALINASNL